LQTLLELCADVCRALREHPRDDVPKKFILAFATKATQTLRAIILLYENDLPQEAQSLIRVAFELRVTFEAFRVLLRADPRRACERVLDSIMLEKVKQQRAVNFKGLDLIPGAPSREDLEAIERKIASRYSESEFKKMRKHGFSGMSVEERSRGAACIDLYDIVYRNFSRNVHSADLTELLLVNQPSLLEEGKADYFDSRDAVGCDVALVSAAAIADAVNALFSLGFDDRFRNLMGQRERVKAVRSNEA
jgi:hypothetical protein